MLALIYFLRFQHLTAAVLELYEVHAFRQIGYEQRFTFYKVELFYFFTNQVKNGNKTNGIIVVVYRDIFRGRIGVNREVCFTGNLGLNRHTEQQKNE